MRPRDLLLLAALLALLPTAHAQMCRIDSPQYGTVEYPCGSGESAPGGAPADEPWWARNSTQALLAVIGLVGSAGAGGYTYYRVRTRRQSLTRTLAQIESTYAAAKGEPWTGIARLAQIRADVREQHARGKLDDVHFLELDKRATTYLVKLRLLEIDRRFATLPPLFLAEIRRLLEDGVLTPAEADLIEVRAAVYRIGEPARSQLIDIARRWAGEDANAGAPEAAASA